LSWRKQALRPYVKSGFPSAKICGSLKNKTAFTANGAFVVVLPNTQQPESVAIAQRIQSQVRSLSIPHQASDIRDIVTVSMGICTTIPADDLPEELVKQADVALYRAKQQGRDRYMVFS